MADEIKITAEPFQDPNICKFGANRPIYPSGSFMCTSHEMAKDHPLLEALFELKGIEHVLLAGNNVTVAKSTAEGWPIVGKAIGQIIRNYLQSHSVPLSAPIEKKSGSDAKIRSKVEEVLNTQINPSVAAHGGVVTLLDVKDNNVYIQMGGGCQGCGQADVTLKQGIETAIRQQIPEVTNIYDTTDHAAGTNPFYAPSSK